MKRKRFAQIFFILLTLTLLWYINGVLCIKSRHGIDQTRALYYQPRNSIDVVMMGSSHIHCDIDTGLLWKKYGIASYDYSSAEQPLWCTYYYLREVCKYQKPKVIVLDLYSPAHFKEDHQYNWLEENIYGMRPSINKLQMILASVEPDRLSDYFPSFASYPNRYFELTKEDFLYPLTARKKMSTFKGFTPLLNTIAQIRPDLDEKSSMGTTVKSEIYLTKIIEYAKENDIELFLIVTPYITNDDDEAVYNRLKEIAGYYDIQFNSTNYYYDEMGLDFKKDFYDDSHLNYWGAYKFTEYLGQQLKSRFDIPDRRGEPGYETWEANFEEIAEYVRNNN